MIGICCLGPSPTLRFIKSLHNPQPHLQRDVHATVVQAAHEVTGAARCLPLPNLKHLHVAPNSMTFAYIWLGFLVRKSTQALR